MGLVFCPECGTKVSDKASECPYCGFRSSLRNLPMKTDKKALKHIQWDEASLISEFDRVFPISTIQKNNLNLIFGKAENLSRVAPAFFETLKAMKPITIKIAENKPRIEELIDQGILRFLTDKNGEILPSVYGKDGIVAQVRLRELKLTPDLGQAIIDLQTQAAMAQIISEIRDVKRSIANLHNELHDDRLALAESAWHQLHQAAHISDTRLREGKLLNVLAGATEAKCILSRAFKNEKRFFDEREGKNWFYKLLDKEAHSSGDEKSSEIFISLQAITTAVQIETTAYSLLGEQNAARVSLQQFSEFIRENGLDNRDTLLAIHSYGSTDRFDLIEKFTNIQRNITTLLMENNNTQLLTDTISEEREEDNNEESL